MTKTRVKVVRSTNGLSVEQLTNECIEKLEKDLRAFQVKSVSPFNRTTEYVNLIVYTYNE